MYKKVSYFIVISFLFSFLHTFFSGCRLVDGQDPGLESNSSLSLNNLTIEANCTSELFVGENFSCQPKVTINAQEFANNQLTWELSQLNTCQWININAANGSLFGSANSSQIGSCLLAFRVKTTAAATDNTVTGDQNVDNLDVRSEYSFSVSVKPPKVLADYKNCLSIVGVGDTFQCDIFASNGVLGSTYTYELSSSNQCSWVILDSQTGHFRGSPTASSVGTCKLVAQARDIFGSVGSKEISVTIPAVTVNITPTNCPNTVKANSAYSCELLGAVNLADKTLIWSLNNDNTCSWAAINSNTGTVTGMPGIVNSNTLCSLSVKATSANGIAQGGYITSVQVPKAELTIAETSCAATANVGASSICSLKATTDIQNAQIDWSKESNNTCNFASVSSGSGDISLAPTVNDVGTCLLSVSATLGGVIKTKWSKNISVAAVPVTVNLTNCASSLNADTNYSCTAIATSSLTGVSYLWSFAPANTCTWLNINSNSGVISGTSNIGVTGNCNLAVSAKLGNASVGLLTKTITVAVKKYIANTLSDFPMAATSASAGTAVSADGSYVVVGAPTFAQGDGSTGKVLVYTKDSGQNSMTLKQIINPSDSKMRNFGYSVSIKGSVLVIGAPTSTKTSTSQGVIAVYEMSGSTWTQTAIVWGTSTAVNGYFGSSVSTDGTKILVGTGHYSQPAAYTVVKNSGWVLMDSLDFTAVNSSSGIDRIKVALNGGQAIVADKIGGAAHNGEVHIYDFVGASFVKKAVPLSGGAGEGYGSSIAFFKNWILVGAPTANLGAGKAYLYEKDGSSNYNLKTLISSAYFKNNDNCGMSVAMYENVYDRILLGCPTTGADTGSVYSFFLNPADGTFAVSSKILTTAGKVNDQFGTAVAGSAGLVVIGAKLFDLPLYTDSGNAFTFTEGP